MIKNLQEQKYTYVVIESISKIEGEDVLQYGISMRTSDSEVAVVENISEELSLVEKLAEVLTKEQIDTISLEYIVDDFINESYTYY